MFAGRFERGERADADVDLAGAEREDPAVAAEDLAVLATQLEVRADPRVVRHPRGDVGPARHAVDRVAVPLATEQLAERRPDAVRHHQPTALDLERTRRPTVNSTAATRSPSMRTPTARAPSSASAPLLIATVRRWSSSSVRATAEPHDGRSLSGSVGQGSSSVCPKPCARSPWLTVCAPAASRSRPRRVSSPMARGVSPSPQVLSRGKTCASTSSVSSPARAHHAAAADPAGPAPTTRTSVEVGRVTSRFSQAAPTGWKSRRWPGDCSPWERRSPGPTEVGPGLNDWTGLSSGRNRSRSRPGPRPGHWCRSRSRRSRSR